jgi:hypothetical protein
VAKPSSITTWATDPGATADPGPARRATGFIAGKKLPSKWLNWLLSQNAAWLTYLRDLHTEPEFLGEDYAWTGTHDHPGAVNIAGPLDVTSGNVRFAGMRTTQNIAFTGTTEPIYTDAFGNFTMRPRMVLVNLRHGIETHTLGAYEPSTMRAVYEHTSWLFRDPATLTFPLEMPRGAHFISARVGLRNVAAADRVVNINVMASAAHKTTPSATSGAPLSSDGRTVPMGAEAIVTLPVNPLLSPLIIDNAAVTYSLLIEGEQNVRIYWIELNYLDPGPRNG